MARILSVIDKRNPLHIFGQCANTAFNMCFAFRRQHTNVWCHEGTNVSRYFSKQSRSIFELMFGFYPYVAFVEDDLVASNRLVEYLELSRKLMEMDETILCAYVQSDEGMNNTASYHLSRQAVSNAEGWMSSVSVYKRFIRHQIGPFGSIGNDFISRIVNQSNINESTYGKCRFACVGLKATQNQQSYFRPISRIQTFENMDC